MSTHFTAMLKAMVTEFQKSVEELVESVTHPLLAVIEALQVKKNSKASLVGLQEVLEKLAKKKKNSQNPSIFMFPL